MSSKRVSAFCLLALSALMLFAQATPPPDSKGKQVVAAALNALGGDRFLQMRTRVASGRIYSFFHDQLSGLDIATLYTEYPEQKPSPHGLAILEREVLGKKQDYSYLFLADQAWDVTYRGARPVPDESWQRYFRSTENDILYLFRTRRNEPGMDFDYIGSDVEISRHIEIVDITDSSSRTIRVFFDHNTNLPVRQSYSWIDEETKQKNDEVTVFDKYRDIGEGIMWPFSIERERNGYKTYQFFANKVEANQPSPPKTFELPSKARMLKKVD